MKEERAIVFIDGNNLYHGMRDIKLSPDKLDYAKFSRKLTQDRIWEETRYYIGEVPEKGELTHYKKQQNFFASFAQYDRVNYFKGRLEHRTAKKLAKRLSRWLKSLPKRDDITIPQNVADELRSIIEKHTGHYEEKAVDVMIAVDMVSMAHQNKYDVAYLISADGDYTPAVSEVRKIGKRVFVASPRKGHEISEVAEYFIKLHPDFFDDCWKEK